MAVWRKPTLGMGMPNGDPFAFCQSDPVKYLFLHLLRQYISLRDEVQANRSRSDAHGALLHDGRCDDPPLAHHWRELARMAHD